MNLKSHLADILQLRAQGGSMTPLIRPGQEVRIQLCEVAHLRIGDVVLFQAKQRLTLHRILRIEKDEDGKLLFTTQGDNRNTPDAVVAQSQILGKMLPPAAVLDRIRWLTRHLLTRLK